MNKGTFVMHPATYWIEKLRLEKHPEGGFFRETYRSAAKIDKCCLGNSFDDLRSVSTAIFFLLRGSEFSAFHKIKSDEIWHHYTGVSLTIHVIDQSGKYVKFVLGKNVAIGENLQVIIPAGSWLGATVNDPGSYALVGCTVSPGFDFHDFIIGQRDELINLFPSHKQVIKMLSF